MTYPLPVADARSVGLSGVKLEALCQRIEAQVSRGEYPGAQVAVARHGKLVLSRSFGLATLSQGGVAVSDDTLFLLYSNTKVITAATIWSLVEDGLLRFGDRIAEHVPGFERHRKGEITIIQLLTHQAGFPSATISEKAWDDHDLLRQAVCDIAPEWVAGTRVHYHPASAHWVAAVLIESVLGKDFREVIRERILQPLGLQSVVRVGVHPEDDARLADMHDPAEGGMRPRMPECTQAFRQAGVPGGGGFGTAAGMAAFYQMLVQGGVLGEQRLLSRRLLAYVTQNFTEERPDLSSGIPMHFGLGPHLRGGSLLMPGLGLLAHPRTFGHGGAGSSQCWGDPESGVSFAFLSNARLPEDQHDERMDVLSNLVHASIVT
jgi:CubicO group peptidase (beta-lactamase class C family)